MELLFATLLMQAPVDGVMFAVRPAASMTFGVLPPARQAAEQDGISRESNPLSYAQRELQSRDLEEFSGGSGGVVVLIVVVAAVLILFSILVPW